MNDSDIPLLFGTGCFSFAANESRESAAGLYNPRIDAIMLGPETGDSNLDRFVQTHEGLGHRGIAVQGTLLRVERHFAGLVYAHIASLLQLLADTGANLKGTKIDNLELKDAKQTTDFALNTYVYSSDDALIVITNYIQQFHAAIRSLETAIRVVYEVVATAEAVDELHRRMTKGRADHLESKILQVQESALRHFPGGDRFRELYTRFHRLPHSLRFVVGLHALDVGDWHSEKGGMSFLTANVPDQIPRFANLLSSQESKLRAQLTAAMAFDTREHYDHELKMAAEFLRYEMFEVRVRDTEMFHRWRFQQTIFGGINSSIEDHCRFPLKLMALLDELLYDPVSREHECIGDDHDCLVTMNESLFRIEVSSSASMQGNRINFVICDRLSRLAPTFEVPNSVMNYFMLLDGSDDELPLKLEDDWYKWLLLFETLYQSLVQGKGASCPLALNRLTSCARNCPIRTHLEFLKKRSDLVSGPLCRLSTRHPLAEDHHLRA